jgi:hypothetical protein
MSNVTDPRRPSAPQPKVRNLPNRNQKGRTTSLQRLVTGRDPRRKSG